MKKLKFYLSVCLLACSTIASAQFVNSGSGTTVSTTTSSSETWSGLRVSYKPITLEWEDGDEDMTGFSLDYVFSFKLSETTPLFLESGIGYQYASYDDDGMEITLHSSNVPLNIGYKHLFNDEVSIMPFVGLNLRVNHEGYLTFSDDEELDLFDDNDMGDNMVWKRIQIGWQIGAGLNFNKFYVGVSYGGDFSDLADKVFEKLGTTSITVGFNF